MGINTGPAKKITTPSQRRALSSPLRLELLGLFVSAEPLAISDMAALMQRSASSLYHHVRILEEAGILQETGTRPKGKRHEALYLPTAPRFEYAAGDDETSISSAVKLVATGFRMAERDLDAALRDEQRPLEDPDPDFYAYRLHFRASPRLLDEVNKHLNAVLELLRPNAKTAADFGPDDQHVALTLALLPIKGRQVNDPDKRG